MPTPSSRLGRTLMAPLVAAALVAAMLTLAPSAAHAQKIRPDFFGMHDGRIAKGGYPSTELGSIRLWDSGTTWRHIEPTEGLAPAQWNWAPLDAAVAAAALRNDKPMIVLGQTPTFYAKNPNSAGAYGPGANSMPNVKKWTRYVKAVAQRYQLQAEYQIWNEPNVKNYWSGSPAQMALLTKVAFNTINKVNRKARVISPSMPLRLKGQRTWFSKYWSQKVGGAPVKKFVDVVGIHSYPLDHQEPEHGQKLIGYAKRVLTKKDVRKPMWNLEINYGLRGGPAADPIPGELQAGYVARTFLLNAASPIKRVYWYRWDLKVIANTILTESDNNTPTMAGRAFGITRGWLVGTSMRGCDKLRNGMYVCTATKGRREGRKFYWKPSGSAVTIKTPRRTNYANDVLGVSRADGSGQRIKIGKYPVMVSYRR